MSGPGESGLTGACGEAGKDSDESASLLPIFLPCIMGPTGAGKTAASLALAERLDISVVNADSRQVYRDFPIITAQPTREEQECCPHLLYGYLPASEKIGAGAYARVAAETIATEFAKGRQPLLVGGTGLYFQALLSGIAPIPPVSAEIFQKWQKLLLREGSPVLHTLLREKDPLYAARIHPNDKQRVTRALEVLEATGKPFSWWHGRSLPASSYIACKTGIALPLSELEAPLARRIDCMLEAGALDEARKALESCPDPAAPGWFGIGCAELYRHLTGELSLDDCRALWLKNTRAYAKRQLTWFRADPDIRWFRPGETAELVAHVLRCRDKGSAPGTPLAKGSALGTRWGK